MSDTTTVSPLRQRMIEDMAARKLNPHTRRSHVYSCKRFAAWLKRSPDTATPDEVRHKSGLVRRSKLSDYPISSSASESGSAEVAMHDAFAACD
jgi:hypothetical protein